MKRNSQEQEVKDHPGRTAGRQVEQTSLWLPGGKGYFYAMLTSPESAPSFCLLMLPPFLHARKSAVLAMTQTARQAASIGGAVLRIDPRGCGDSPGELDDLTPLDWIDDLRQADDWLRQTYPGLPVIWLGIRFAAGICLAAAEKAAPSAIVTWAPLLSGTVIFEHWVRRRRINQMLSGRPQEKLSAIKAALAGGKVVDFDGFPLTSGFVAALTSLDAATGPPLPETRDGLAILTAADPTSEKALRRRLPQCETVRRRVEPFWDATGVTAAAPMVEATIAWLAARARPGERAGPAIAVAPPDPDPALPLPVAIGPRRRQMRGLYHLPPPGASALGKVLFLHGWAGCRLGPQDLFPRAAGYLSRNGYACLRIDFRGRGESDGDPASAAIPGMAEDAAEALAWLKRQPPEAAGIHLVAICSGCKAALCAASGHPGTVSSLTLWSAEPMGRLREAGSNRRKTGNAILTYSRKLLQPDTWRRLRRGQVRLGMVGRAVLRHETRSRDEARAENRALDRLTRDCGRLLFIFGETDQETPSAAAAYRDFSEARELEARTVIIAGAGHNFSSRTWETRLLQETLKEIEKG